jgi:DNA-directed RNA polymerase specialized sigma24 family protein
MEKKKIKWRISRPENDTESLLESYYSQLLKWGAALSRGDTVVAQEIVHDLCLYFALAKPDLSKVENLDGYLYTSLRNIYLSTLARLSREATQFVSVAEFDTIHFALKGSSSDSLLQRQNDLRRICNYAIWRKDSSKSASYLILLFFHGYSRREVAEIARVPIAAIYNKLKIARVEVKAYLEGSGKLRIATREPRPQAELRVSPVSSVELFSEFRQMILRSVSSQCLPEEELLFQYQTPESNPISCALLSHLVSCTRCLSLIDRRFQWPTLEDREPPADFGSAMDDKREGHSRATSFSGMMRGIQRELRGIYEHRPRTLSIAVNGKITAYHDVHGERSALSSRIDNIGDAQFVEVFTEQQVRLALLPIDARPPEGSHIHSQRVNLSDDRWLELTLSFDGLGLNSEVTYYDPALAVMVDWEEAEDSEAAVAVQGLPLAALPMRDEKLSLIGRVVRILRASVARPTLAWSVALACVVIAAGFFAYRSLRPPLFADKILTQSAAIEAADLNGNAVHEIIQLDETTSDGRIAERATVDLWREGHGGTYVRRLYNEDHQLIAAEWRTRDGNSGTYAEGNNDKLSNADQELKAGSVWRENLSAGSFRKLADDRVLVRKVGNDYELTASGSRASELRMISGTLVLDRNLRPVSEVLNVDRDGASMKVHLVLVSYERRPSYSVPGSVYDPASRVPRPNANVEPTQQRSIGKGVAVASVQLVQAHISVLYQLSKVDADMGEPIQVTRTNEGKIRISGVVADDKRKAQIRAGLESLPERQFLDIRLTSQREMRMAIPSASSLHAIGQSEAPAAAILRKYFASKGWSGNRIDTATGQFSQDVLGHAQRALQNAFALNRLGVDFSAAELKSVDPASKQQWAQMIASHASALESELNELHEQLAEIAVISDRPAFQGKGSISIEDPAAFARMAGELLRQTQVLMRNVGAAFASGSADKSTQDPKLVVANTMQSIPLRDATNLADFASRLTGAARPNNAQTISPNNR